MQYNVREMEQKDIKQVQDVAKRSWNATYTGIIPIDIQRKFLGSAYNDDMIRRRLEASTLYVAEVDKKVVGFINFSPTNQKNAIELSAIYLYPEHHGKGIGTALLQVGIRDLKNVHSIYVNVEKENISGLTFYKARGFKPVSEYTDNLFGHMTTMMKMILRI